MNALSLHLPVTSRGLTSNKSSQQLKELIPFEDDLIDLVKNIKKKVKSNKNEIGRITKQILDQINSKLCEILKVNEWKNTASVINWFKKIESKSSHKFLMFDIKDFYPSIKEGLLIEALEFAKQQVTINSKDRETIFHARKSLL